MLKGESTLYKNPNSNTLVLTIPSRIATDSQFPFKPGETVLVEFFKGYNNLMIKKKPVYLGEKKKK